METLIFLLKPKKVRKLPFNEKAGGGLTMKAKRSINMLSVMKKPITWIFTFLLKSSCIVILQELI